MDQNVPPPAWSVYYMLGPVDTKMCSEDIAPGLDVLMVW